MRAPGLGLNKYGAALAVFGQLLMALAPAALAGPSGFLQQRKYTLPTSCRAYPVFADTKNPHQLQAGDRVEIIETAEPAPFMKVRLMNGGILAREFWVNTQEADPFGTIRNFDKMVADINRSLGGSGPACSMKNEDALVPTVSSNFRFMTPSRNPAVRGARKVFATLYQDCSVVSQVIRATDIVPDVVGRDLENSTSKKFPRRTLGESARNDYLLANPMLRYLGAMEKMGRYPAPGCQNVLLKPPIYSYGAKPRSDGSGVIAITTPLKEHDGVAKESTMVSGMDCSGFISAAFAASGLKFSTEDGFPLKARSTDEIHDLADERHKRHSCLLQASFDPVGRQSLLPGDVINLQHDHVVMIDSVGPDPFGIQKVQDCSNLGVEHFDFTYIQSGSLGSFGVTRVEAAYHAKNRATWMNGLLHLARRYCEAEKAHTPLMIKPERSAPLQVFRHAGAQKRGCTTTKVSKLQGEQCVQSCRL